MGKDFLFVVILEVKLLLSQFLVLLHFVNDILSRYPTFGKEGRSSVTSTVPGIST